MPKFLEVTDKAAARTALGGINGLVINFADYGACDGVTNDAAALIAALAGLDDAGGGTLQLPPKSIALTLNVAGSMFTIPANTKVVGTAGATKLLLSTSGGETTGPSDYRCFAATGGNNVTIEGVELVRQSDYTLVFLTPGTHDGFHIRNCVLDGRFNSYPTNYVHGILLDAAGTKSNITIKGSTIKRLWYGLLQNNPVTATCDTIVVDDCVFTANFKDDLCFNAPMSTMKNVSVLSSRFTNNVSTDERAGFGVCFAHVAGGTVHDCSFENYGYEPIHVEDLSTHIAITGNRITDCGTVAGGGIMIQTNSTDVVISGNVIDATANTSVLFGILVLNGGSTGTTPGGRTEVPPSRVVVSDNIIRCGAHYRGIYVENASNITMQGNQVYGAGSVTAGVWNQGNTKSGIVADGSNITIAGNTVSGFRLGMSGPYNTRSTLADPGVVSGNVISDCYVGIHAASPGAVTITGNTMSNCVRPLVVGEAGATAKPCTVTGNFSTGCVYPLEIGGRLTVMRDGTAGTVTVGAARPIWVTDKMLKLPVGTVITFSGGGVFTVTTGVAAADASGTYPLVGDVTVASITASEVGTITALAHSTTGANNKVMIGDNTDTVAGVFTLPLSSLQSSTTATLGVGAIELGHASDTTLSRASAGVLAVEGTLVPTISSTNAITNKDLRSATNTFPTFDSDQLSAGLQTLPRWMLVGFETATASDFVYLTYCTAHKDLSVTTINMLCGATAAAATPTLVRIGIYSENTSTGALTLVGSTANDTSLFGTAFTGVTKALSATTALTAGTRYAFGLLVVSAAACPTPYGVATPSALATLAPRRAAVAPAVSSDLPTSIAAGALFASGALMYVAAT